MVHAPDCPRKWAVRAGRSGAKALAALAWLWAAAAPAPAAEPAPAHLTQVETWASPSRNWAPPSTLAQSDDAVLAPTTRWQKDDLPFTRQRETMSSAEQALAGPEVEWIRAQVPADALVATPQGPRLYIPRWQTIGTLALYVDGSLVWLSHGSRVWNSFNEPVWVDLSGRLRPDKPFELHVRMASQPGVGGALSTLWIGPAETLRTAWRWRSYLQIDLVAYLRGAFLVLGALSLAVWLMRRRRGEIGYLLFALLAVANALSTLFYLVDAEGFDVQDDWFSWLSLVTALWAKVFAFLLLARIQDRRPLRLTQALMAYCALISLASIPIGVLPHQAMLPLLRMALLPPALMLLWLAASSAWQRSSPVNVLMAVAIALTFPLGIHDLALQRYRVNIENIYLTPYVSMGVLIMFLLLAFARYNRALVTAERASASLAKRLAEQEQTLRETHGRLLAAERDQTLLQERQRLMREMHDGVGSTLQSALQLVETGPDAHARQVAQMLREGIDELKLSIDSLEPADADLPALLGSLRHRLGPRLQAAGLTLHWDVHDLPALPWLDPKSALHVLRILQEVLTNILKHGDATSVTVSTGEASCPLPSAERGVQVCIYDDGPAFAPPPPDRPTTLGRGMANVRGRTQALGGHCSWAPCASGTLFTLWLPLRQRV